jgi:hypothetical protein
LRLACATTLSCISMGRRCSMARRDRISMDKQAQILKLAQRGYSVRGIASSLKMCRKAVRKYVEKAALDSRVVFPAEEEHKANVPCIVPDPLKNSPDWLKQLDWKYLVSERQKGVSFKILFKEIPNLEVNYWSFWKHLKFLCEK